MPERMMPDNGVDLNLWTEGVGPPAEVSSASSTSRPASITMAGRGEMRVARMGVRNYGRVAREGCGAQPGEYRRPR